MEVWKDVYFYCDFRKRLFDYRGLYQVSNKGRVKSLDRMDTNNHFRKGQNLTLKNRKRPCGKNDLMVSLSKKGKVEYFLVSRLVAYMFIENDDPKNKIQINHKDENPENNNVENLEWCTASYNINYGTRTERWKAKRKGWKQSKETKERISNSLKGDRNHMCGKHHTDTSKEKQRISKGKKIIAINMKNNEKIFFNSIREAHEKGFDRSCIFQCLKNGGNQTQHKGYKWYEIEILKL